ncbi:S-adenosyl-L-methionine-dependent methyltransferase [Cerioporus squamosus]|nr:S-adenosyl-L-methionine-dependent methyltransferase [Cerioporus squamosus]
MTWARNRGLVHALRSATLQWPRRPQNAIARRCYGTGPEPVTAVEKILLDTIKATGPISYATYMQMCLSHPSAGYYMNPSNAVIGSRGDFITSPEISQVFGELLGVWLLSQWMLAGQARKIRFVELGPGRGTLMHDMLRVFSQFPAARSVVEEIHLVETSPAMRSAQEAKLGPLAQSNGWNLTWRDAIDDIPHDASKFTLVVAHEFFDALPFHLLQKTEQGWRELLIASGPDPAAPTPLRGAAGPSLDFSSVSPTKTLAARLRQVLSSTPTASSTLLGLSSPRFQKLPVGSRVEVSPASFKIARQVAELLHEEGSDGVRSAGSALIVDYGSDRAYGNSFRAFKYHKIVDVFYRPGECDLTVNVDFAYLQEAVTDLASHHGPIPQALFLHRMGLQARVNALKASAEDKRKKQIEDAASRLVDPTGMGSQYKVMALMGKRKAEPTEEERWPFVDLREDSKR